MKNFLFIVIIIFFSFNSCKSTKQVKGTKPTSSRIVIGPNRHQEISSDKTIETKNLNTDSELSISSLSKAFNIVEYAMQFKGVRYKFGGATKSGMDCSGLVFESFRAYDVILPRISREMAKNGEKISLNDAGVGDLLFFKTGNKRNDISHVGLVVSTSNNGVIEFIHSTTSAGVIISSITETYWDKTFVEARRIL